MPKAARTRCHKRLFPKEGEMRWGLMNLGMGPFTRPEWMAEAAGTAEGRGFNSLFVGEHFAFFDNYRSYDPYLYRPEGELPMTSAADILDPSLTFPWLPPHPTPTRPSP